MSTPGPTRELGELARMLPGERLRAVYAARREEFAELPPEDRRAHEARLSMLARAAAPRELDGQRARDRWAMWCRSVPARYRDDRADAHAFVPRPASWWLDRLDARQYPERIAAWLASDSSTLLLIGPTGTGKTHAAIAAGYAAAGQAVHTRFTSQLHYLEQLRPGGSDDPGRVRWNAVHTDLLILDDLGAETEGGTEFVRREVCALLEGRLNEQRRQIITLNASYDSLTATFGDRIMDRLVSDAVRLKLDGESRRRAAKAPW